MTPSPSPANITTRTLKTQQVVPSHWRLWSHHAGEWQIEAEVEMASPLVVPIDWTRFTAGLPADVASRRAGTILNNTNKYALTTWYNTIKNFDAQTGTYLDCGGIAEGNIRPSASEALALAASLRTGLYDPAITGVAVVKAKAVAGKLIRSLAYRHRINLTGGWGGVWQSGLWAAYAGVAGWLMWDDPSQSSTDRQNVREMVEYEANRYIGYKVPYYKDAAGTTCLSRGQQSRGERLGCDAAADSDGDDAEPREPSGMVLQGDRDDDLGLLPSR